MDCTHDQHMCLQKQSSPDTLSQLHFSSPVDSHSSITNPLEGIHKSTNTTLKLDYHHPLLPPLTYTHSDNFTFGYIHSPQHSRLVMLTELHPPLITIALSHSCGCYTRNSTPTLNYNHSSVFTFDLKLDRYTYRASHPLCTSTYGCLSQPWT